ncbi:protein kinase domain-containing protein [Streptomyces sp. NPDC002125]
MQALNEDDPNRIADYRLLGRLGEGGMGVVYLARSTRGRMVAVKSIRPELAALPDFRRRFAQEVAIARRVGSDWTAAVLDADPHAERPWAATAYVPGPTLAEVVERHGPLPERSVRGLVSGLCDALAAIHATGLVHRDLKPSNIMITIDGPKVIDFGIVRALDGPTHGGLTSTGVVVGSPGFMAPEQVRGERLTTACDIFALGSVLAFAASGRLPFAPPEGGAHAVMYRVVHEEPELTGVPEPLLPLVLACLAKSPTTRPDLTALRAWQKTQPHHRGPWLPAPLLARLGQDAAELLEHEDPATRSAGHAGNRTAATVPATAKDTRVGPAARNRTLAEERRTVTGRHPSTTAVLVAAGLYGVLALASCGVQLIRGDTWQSWHETARFTLGPALGTAAILLAIVWLIWCARTRTAAEEFAPGRLRYGPSVAVTSWFIPFGNLILPKRIADDVWHASGTRSPGGGMAPAARLHTWWWLWIVSGPLSPLFWVSSVGWMSDYFRHHDLEAAATAGLLIRLLAVPTAVATALYVSRLSAMQQAHRSA